jgi:hypothetical protein
MRFGFLPLVVLASVLMAQQTPSAAPEEKKFATVEGKLTDAVTGEPLRKANLVLMQLPSGTGGFTMAGPPPSTTTSSDAEGRFSFPKVEPGRYMLSAEKAGYVRQGYGSRGGSFSPGANLVVEAGQRLANIDFKLMPQAVITGKVVDEDGEPVPHTMVQVLRRTAGARQPMGMMGMSANDVGEFRLAGLAPGRYLLRAEHRGSMYGAAPPVSEAKDGEGTLGYVPTFYPGVSDEAAATEIAVAAGQQLSGMDIRLRKARVFQVSGKIQGAPAGSNRIQVSLQPRRTGRGGGTMFGFGGGGNVKPDGTFTLASVLPGSWDAVAISVESGRPQMLGRAPVTVTNANVENVVILAGSPIEVSGRVVLEGDPGQPEASKAAPTGQVILQPLHPIPMFVQPARIQEDGTFKISGVARDAFRLDVMGLTGTQYVKSVLAGGVDVTANGLDLSSAETAPPIEIRISPKGGVIAGVVQEGDKPAPAVIVTALPQPFNPDRRIAMKSATTDQNGRFTIQGLAPGEYRIYAVDTYVPFHDFDAEQMKPFDKLATAVKVREAGSEQIEVKLVTTPRE